MNQLVCLPRLREKMNNRGLSNARLAEEAKVSESTIKRILAGTPTTFVTAEMIAIALETTVTELSANEPAAPPNGPAMTPNDPSVNPNKNDKVRDDPNVTSNEPNEDNEIELREAITMIERVYLSRIEDWRQRVEDHKAANTRSRKEYHALLIFTAILVGFICMMLAIDILNPTVGWIRS